MSSLTSLRVIASCAECGLESAGRCSVCRRNLCPDHYPFEEHQPCADRMRERAGDFICYVCGAPVQPRQWSAAIFSHYIDTSRCAGCHRYVCDERHTRVREDSVALVRDSVRSHRDYVTRRYCDVCAPLRFMGGLLGLTRVLAVAGALGGVAWYLFQHVF